MCHCAMVTYASYRSLTTQQTNTTYAKMSQVKQNINNSNRYMYLQGFNTQNVHVQVQYTYMVYYINKYNNYSCIHEANFEASYTQIGSMPRRKIRLHVNKMNTSEYTRIVYRYC